MSTVSPGKIILALPAYNEADNLPALVPVARQVLAALGPANEILVVDDGSSDTTPATLEKLAAESSPVPLLIHTHPKNRGLGGAIMTLIRTSTDLAPGPDDIIICMDADNTHDPSYIPKMVDQIRAGADVVIASRFRDGSQEVGVPFGRRVLSRGARLLFRIFLRLPDIRDYTCGYRAYRSTLLREALAKYGDELITRSGFACTDELLVKLSTISKKMTEIPFVLRYDKKRSPSKLPLFQTIWETLKMLVSKH